MKPRNSAPSFLSYCRSQQPPPCFLRARRASVLPLLTSNLKVGARSVPTFSSQSTESFRIGNQNLFACAVILGFLFRMQNKRPYKVRRTSCVLCIPRILTDARYAQHACRGLRPPGPPPERGQAPRLDSPRETRTEPQP